MKWLLIVACVFILIFLVVLTAGLLQPAKHSVTRSIHLRQKPETVFAVLEGNADLPSWSTTVSKVEPLPDRDGKPVARYTLKWGGMKMIVTQLERKPPTLLVCRMAKEEGAILGTWTYQLASESDGCRISLTEDGELANPLYRAVARLRGLDVNIKQTLLDLTGKFGEMAESL